MGRKKTEGMADQGSEALRNSRDNLVGSYVCKDCSFGASKDLLGKVVSYDCITKLFRVIYEGGHAEDLGQRQLGKILMVDEGGSGMKISCRKRKLDQLVPSASGSKAPNTRNTKSAHEVVPDGSQASSVDSHLALDLSEDADSSSNSCDHTRALTSDNSSQDILIPQLPPSSGDICVPEESVADLFSVYNFLRSFSLQLFLSPFGLHDFVGALNCTIQNSLLDAVHVSLMRALRRHLEMLSSEGSELASKCLRHYDWALLDTVTWPAFLVEYLYIMGYLKGLHDGGISIVASGSEYYGLPVATKLKVLQILCDNIIDSAELRTELEMRENFEEEKEYNAGASHPPESGPTRVHPRHSKTSAWKDTQLLESSAEINKPNIFSTVREPGADATDATLDGNSDECLLCGMDGTLICCDGCPSAYHSRCIGLNKAFLPNGLWFCPECSVNKLGPTSSRVGRGIRGAEVFGIDTYGTLFLGTCNYLLVTGTSLNVESVSRYYNQDDVAKVLSVICSSGENLSAYEDICKGISKYWELQLVDTQSGKIESIRYTQVDNEPAMGYVPSSITPGVFCNGEGENHADKITENSADNKAILCQKDDCSGARADDSAFDLLDQTGFPDSQKFDMAGHDVPNKQSQKVTDETSFPPKNVLTGNATKAVQKTLPFMHTKSSEQHGSGSVVSEVSYLNQPISAERSTALDSATCASVNGSGICREDVGSSSFSKKNDSISASYESKPGSLIYGEKCRSQNDKRSIVPAFFKPHAYINQYVLGDIAASSAANLAVLASEESRVSEAHLSSNPRKVVAANTALQMKAFSGAAMHFLWPNYEKKLVEVPRERCGWCIACKGTSLNKKGCLLNLAAANAIKGFARSISGLRPVKHEESHLPVIAAYIANMEESLSGLINGPFLVAEYNQQWRKQVREASSCKVLKSLLLEFEKNIRGIAFSGVWIKMVDDWPVESSAVLTGMSHVGPNQKHVSGGRRNKKQSRALKHVQLHNESEHYVQWWRGEKLSKVIFQKGALPSSLVKKAARQAGRKWIPDISYSEGSELPRRNRQLAWRASVDMSKNASQLALQVRYLDAHLRWRDLVRPDQTPLEGKGSDVDATAFRNAVICDKKITENKIAYALIFANQKHLPLRVTKNILEAERTQDENGKLWFSENHVPLYLIKEFEEKVGAQPLPRFMKLGLPCLTKFQKRQLKSCRREIFSYLLHKLERPSKDPCVSCQRDVLFRDAVRCSTCQGYCHKECTIPSTVDKEDDLEFLFTCNSCYHAKFYTVTKIRKEVSSCQLSSQGQDQQLAGAKCMLQVGSHQTARPSDKMEVHSEMQSVSGSNSKRKARSRGLNQTYGLIWKKKNNDNSDLGEDFRLENIILKSKEGMDPSKRPTCCLCGKDYRSDLMYVRCEKCQKWCHADALNLEESQIFNLVGFKCCKCRRITLPRCPYLDSDLRKSVVEPLRRKNAERKLAVSAALVPQSKVEDLIMVDDETLEIEVQPMRRDPSSKKRNAKRNERAISKHPKLAHPTTLGAEPELKDLIAADDDPLLHSLGRVEPIEQMLDVEVHPNGPGLVSQGQQKLSVRRPQLRHEMNDDAVHTSQDPNSGHAPISEDFQNPDLFGNDAWIGTDEREFPAIEEATFASASENDQVGWDCGYYGNGEFDNNEFGDQLHDPEIGNNEGSEYEPQTYFSFTELLASEDEELGNLFDFTLDTSDDYCPLAGSEDFGTINQDPSSDPSGAASASFAASDEPSFHVATCEKCKLDQPSPDLTCEICSVCIHSHCSPWVDSEETTGGGQWRCGSCRDWR